MTADSHFGMEGSDQLTALAETVLKHSTTDFVPGAAEVWPLTRVWVFDPDHQAAISEDTQAKLARLVAALYSAREAFDDIDAEVKRALEYSFAKSDSAKGGRVRFFTHNDEPFLCFEQIRTLLDYLVDGLDREDSDGAMANADRMAETLPKASRIAEKHSTWAKVLLIKNARRLWPTMTTKNAPLAPSPGTPFFEFIGDLVVTIGQDWDTESALKAYRKKYDQG